MEMEQVLNIIQEAMPLIKQKEDFQLAKEMYSLLELLFQIPAYQNSYEELEPYKKDLLVYTFRYLKEEDQLHYFTKGIEYALTNEDINFIIDSVKYFLYSYYAIVDYTTIREQLLQNLYENKELLTDSMVLYKNGKEVSGTVKNWFKHYQLQFDHNKEFRIGMMEYLNKSLALQDLKKEEKEAVKNLIYLIEYLRTDVEEIFSQEANLLYDFGEEGTVGYIDGKYVELKPDPLSDKLIDLAYQLNEEKSSNPKVPGASKIEQVEASKLEEKAAAEKQNINQLKAKVQLSEEEMINFRNIVAKYKTLPDEDIMNYFWEGIDSYNKYLIMGALQELVRRKMWDDLWDLPRLRLLLNDYRSRKLKDLSVDPTDKKMQLKVLLMFLLEQHLSLPLDNAKKWSLYLINYLVKNNYSEYQDLIYFDQKEGRLEWEK